MKLNAHLLQNYSSLPMTVSTSIEHLSIADPHYVSPWFEVLIHSYKTIQDFWNKSKIITYQVTLTAVALALNS